MWFLSKYVYSAGILSTGSIPQPFQPQSLFSLIHSLGPNFTLHFPGFQFLTGRLLKF